MRRLLSQPTRLFTGRAVQGTPTFYAELPLKKHFTGLEGLGRNVIMMEVCAIVSEYQGTQPADLDTEVTVQITLESTNGQKALDNDLILWKRQTHFDLGGGGGMLDATRRDDLTVDGNGEIWPAHKLFIGIDTDISTETWTGLVTGYGFLVEMEPLEAWIWMRERTGGIV